MMIMLTYAVGDRATRLAFESLGGAESFGGTVCDVEIPRKQRSQLGLQLDIALLRVEAALYQISVVLLSDSGKTHMCTVVVIHKLWKTLLYFCEGAAALAVVVHGGRHRWKRTWCR